MKKFIALICVSVMAFAFAGCSSSSNETAKDDTANGTEQTTEATDETKTDEPEEADSLSGSITMAGSTSMEKLATALNEAFMEKYPGVTAQAQFTGSSSGIEAVTAGTVDIGNASRELKDEEISNGVVENIVAIDGIGLVVDKANKVTELTLDDVSKIYTGEIKNWSELGGEDLPIIVIGRESGSGTRGAFEELLKIEDKCQYAQEIDSTGAVIAKVASTPGAIGYVSVDLIDDTVAALNIDGYEPTAENIKAGNYKLSRPFVMATKGAVSQQNEVVKAMFDFINSDEGQQIVKDSGLISAK